MPLRSTGCLTCRKRKIRCDEGRPGCERCAIHGVRCPGYSTGKPYGIEFKDQTSSTAKRAEQRYKTKALNSGSKEKLEISPSSSTVVIDSPAVVPGSVSSTEYVPSTAQPAESHNTQDGSLVVYNNTSTLSPIPIRSPGAERTQIYEEFIATYLPKVRHGTRNAHFDFYQLIALKRSEQPALERGMDALSLVQLGSLYKDQRLLKEAVRQYGIALRYLAFSISKGDFLHDDDVLAAVTCLAGCELYEEIANVSEGWMRHIQGGNQLVAARGPQSMKSDLALLLYSNMRHGALLHALIARKAPFMATAEWRELAHRVPGSVNDASVYFYDAAIQVPGLLQRHDELDINSSTVVSDIDNILEESAKLEAQLRNWWTEWQADATVDNLNDFELRPIDDFQTFTSLVSDRTIDHAFTFPDFMVAYLYSVYWMIMHSLRENIQSLQKLRHRIIIDWYPEPDDVVPEHELLGYVLNLCQCIPFFVEPNSNSSGHIGVFMPMRTAAVYFTDRGHWKWLKWIGAVRNNVFVKGLAPPGVKHAGKESGIAKAGGLLAT